MTENLDVYNTDIYIFIINVKLHRYSKRTLCQRVRKKDVH